MEQNEQRIISDLFAKLQQAETQSGPRDPGAEQQIAAAVSRQPAAPYYMSQVILVQEQAITAQNQRIQELEKELAERPVAGGGFLSGLFGGGAAAQPGAARPAQARTPAMAPGTAFGAQPAAATGRGWGQAPAAPAAGGGFLASALTTAAGVAGGIMMANALTGLFGGSEAHAGEAHGADSAAMGQEPDPIQSDDSFNDDGGDFESFDEF